MFSRGTDQISKFEYWFCKKIILVFTHGISQSNSVNQRGNGTSMGPGLSVCKREISILILLEQIIWPYHLVLVHVVTSVHVGGRADQSSCLACYISWMKPTGIDFSSMTTRTTGKLTKHKFLKSFKCHFRVVWLNLNSQVEFDNHNVIVSNI